MPSNQFAPNTIVTSALKNIGTGLEITIKDLTEGKFKGGEATVYDLSSGGVGYEVTDHLSDELIEYVDNKLENKKIIRGIKMGFSYKTYKELVEGINLIAKKLEEKDEDNYKSFAVEDGACRLISLGNSLSSYIRHSKRK